MSTSLVAQGSAVLNGVLKTTNTTLVLLGAAVAKLRLGVSPGGGDVAHLNIQLGAFPTAQIVRVFDGDGVAGPLATDAVSAAVAAKALEIWLSFSAMPTQAVFQTAVADWIKSGLFVRWTYKHEVDAPKEAAPAYQADYAQLLTWASAVPGYAASRVRDQAIFMGYLLDPTHPHGTPSDWMPPNADRLAFDCYTHQAISESVAFCKSLGKRWAIPEFGSGGPNGEGGVGDDAALLWAQQAVALWQSYPPEAACWYSSTQGNGKSTTLSVLPKTAAYLASLIA